jgi:hypothetical protein
MMMSRDMKTVVHRKGLLHVETPLGIVNIHVGLHDRKSRRVEAITVSGNNYAGEPKVALRGYHNTRLVELKTVKGGR